MCFRLAKVRVVPKAVREVGVVVIKYLAACTLLILSGQALGGILPEDRADVLYHSYDGGDVEVNGPSVLVLKKFTENVSVSAKHYVDEISSASIDVITTASPYTEQRTENSVGIDYLHGKSTLSAGFSNSSENDYEANTASFGVSMDMFGDLTTVSLGYSLGQDTVMKTGQSDFNENIDRHNFKIGLSQVLTKNWLVEFGAETITDEGFLNNPYRSVRYLDNSNPKGYSYEAEIYPRTRTSTAFALRTKYYLPYHAALSGEYRFFTDTWDIEAHNIEFGYSHPVGDNWHIDLSYRYYTQTAASFYSDLFTTQQSQNYLARDKELSTFQSHTFGVSASYSFEPSSWTYIQRGRVTLAYDHMLFSYDDFRDLTKTGDVGEEPLYDLSAGVLQLYLSIWY